MRRSDRLAALLAAIATGGCGAGAPEVVDADYRPRRADYLAFHERTPGLLEPNYLPFMVHRVVFGDERPDALAFCRPSDDAFPLAVHIQPPPADALLEDEFDPLEPEVYVAAVERALAMWERELEAPVRFRRVEEAEAATLRVTLLGERGPTPAPDVRVLGATRLGGACGYRAGRPGDPRLELEFAVPELRIFVADQHGLLTGDQVEWIARHEIGHALGMPAHSPIPADLMFEMVRDRVQVAFGLSDEDVNSFLSLYGLENGTVFAWVPRGGEPDRSPLPPPAGEPRLAVAPHVDPRLGFEVRVPEGWMRLATPRGVVAADGVAWDYEASFQVVVSPFDTLEDYLERYRDAPLGPGRLVEASRVFVGGRRALRYVVARSDDDRVEEVTLIESGDGRIFAIVADAPTPTHEIYRRWFWAALASLEIWPAGRAGEGR